MNMKMLRLVVFIGIVVCVIYNFLDIMTIGDDYLQHKPLTWIHESEKDVARSPPKIAPLDLEISPNKKPQQARVVPLEEETVPAVKKEFEPIKSLCLLSGCIHKDGSVIARAYPDRSNRTWIAANVNATDKLKRGLLLVKVPKAASTTSASVAIRISRHHGDVPVKYTHASPSVRQYGIRHPSESFLFAPVRDPANHALSFIFYHISRLGRVYSESSILESLKKMDERQSSTPTQMSEGRGGFQLRYLSLYEIPQHSAWSKELPTSVLRPTQVPSLQVQSNVKHIIDYYDFLLVVERMDESLVAMALSMGIDLGDVLVTSSKVAGSNYYLPVAGKKNRKEMRCVKLISSHRTPAIEEYLESAEWRAMNYGDYLLHAAANKSLDLTIGRIGRDRFDTALKEYQRLKAKVDEGCIDRIHLPCSSTGQLQLGVSSQNCYERDLGCGFDCIDEMLLNEARRRE
jgi:hypothetical protein